MTHEEKVLLYVMAQPDSGFHLTAAGRRDYNGMVAAGFRPTDKEIAAAVMYLKGEQP